MQQEAPLTKEKLDAILDEIAEFRVDLAEDPTLPELGTKYLQSSLAKCRAFLNRTHYYLQLTKRYEKDLKSNLKLLELNVDLKFNGLLADDATVRQQPSIDDRKALAISMMNSEYEEIAKLRASLMDAEETVKLVKAKYDDLNRTNSDIKLQRHLVKDDKMDQMTGGEGYEKPQARQDRVVTGGLAPPVKAEPIDPKDLLDPNRRPEDMPEPVDMAHAQQIADFFSGRSTGNGIQVHQGPESPKSTEEESVDEAPLQAISYDDLLS